MSFNKHYPNRKDHRRQYRGSAAFDRTCRNGGSCPWCKSNRSHRHAKDVVAVMQRIREYLKQEVQP